MKKTKFILIAFILGVVSVAGFSQDLASKANAFLGTLTPELKTKTQFDLDDAERFKWHFVPLERKGSTFRDYNEAQKNAALDFLKSSLSDQGFKKTTGIIALENVLMVIENQKPESHYRDPLNYHFYIFGVPSKTGPWGWRFEGHHISFSFMLDKGKLISSTPSFFGTNPGIVMTGEEKGKEVLKKETDLGFELVRSLSAEQLKVAMFDEVAPKEIINFNKRKASLLEPVGIKFSALSADQKKVFLQLLDTYVRNYELDFAERFEKKIRAAGIDNLSFAWAGSLQPGVPNYYRIQGPMLVIEYDNTQNNANHVHTTVRDLTSDFAEDLLKSHYQAEHTN